MNVEVRCLGCETMIPCELSIGEPEIIGCEACDYLMKAIAYENGDGGERVVVEPHFIPSKSSWTVRCRQVACGAKVRVGSPLTKQPNGCLCHDCGSHFTVREAEGGGIIYGDLLPSGAVPVNPEYVPEPPPEPQQESVECPHCGCVHPPEPDLVRFFTLCKCPDCRKEFYARNIEGGVESKFLPPPHYTPEATPAPVLPPQYSINKNEGKMKPTLLLQDFQKSFLEILRVRDMGAKKYSRDNWSLSIGKEEAKEFLQDNKDSMARHLMEYLGGAKLDMESQHHVLAHLALRCMIAIEYDS